MFANYFILCALLALAIPRHTEALPVTDKQPRLLRRLVENIETAVLLPVKCAKTCAASVRYYSACQEGLSLFPRETTACRTSFCDRTHWAGLHNCLSCVVSQGWMSPVEALAELDHADEACRSAGLGGMYLGLTAEPEVEEGESPLTRLVMQAPKKRWEVYYEEYQERDAVPSPAASMASNMTTIMVPMPSGSPMPVVCPTNMTMPMPMNGTMPMVNGTMPMVNGTMPMNATMPMNGTMPMLPSGCAMMPMPSPSPMTMTRTLTRAVTTQAASRSKSARSLPTLGLRWLL